MDRKAVARETLDILEKGYYICGDDRYDLAPSIKYSIENSELITPEQGRQLLKKDWQRNFTGNITLSNCSTVDAIRSLAADGAEKIGVLNFASAKNPGGGFINGAMAQEESLAASSTLYQTLLHHEQYYIENRNCGSMIYTNHAIYSPNILFFRDSKFALTSPVSACVLTLPAVNMGQVVLKHEDKAAALSAMRERMDLALAIFAEKGNKTVILGAYGCGVFRNDPAQIAEWWNELLKSKYQGCFESIYFAVLDTSKKATCYLPFADVF